MRTKITTFYLGYELVVDNRSILIIAPNGDTARWGSMSRVRAWVRHHRGEHG